MSVKLHHGDPGSYKTSGALWDDAVPALQAGRIIVTNVRGFTLDKALEVFPMLPDSADVINIDTSNKEGKAKIARWFQWVPLGCFMILDETGVIFPKRWKDRDLALLDFAEGEELGRPDNWMDAWDMHRHYNWDIVLTAPHINRVRTDILDIVEQCYKHKNKALMGKFFKGKYLEGVHSPDNKGTLNSHFKFLNDRKINKEVFKLYDSTTTDEAGDTIAGRSVFKSGSLILALAVASSAIGYSVFSDGYKNLLSKSSAHDIEPVKQTVKPVIKSSKMVSNDSDIQDYIARSNRMVVQSNSKVDILNTNHPFMNHSIYITAFVGSAKRSLYLFKVNQGGNSSFSQSSKQLEKAGYKIKSVSSCYAILKYNKQEIPVTCGSAKKQSLQLSSLNN